MKKINGNGKYSGDAARQVFREFSWSLASVIHRQKSGGKNGGKTGGKPLGNSGGKPSASSRRVSKRRCALNAARPA